ncbi:hypothetical protein V8D89_007911 [Ganoderma adspersum]
MSPINLVNDDAVNTLHTFIFNSNKPTLEVLDLDLFPLDLLPDSITTPFTAVHSLKFRADYISSDFHPLAIRLRLFPNLDHTLVLGSFNTRCTDDELDRLVCDAEWAFVYALRCPVRRMDILVAGAHGKRYLVDTLRNNSPLHLHLSLVLSCHEGWGALDGLLPPEAADRLTHLLVFVSFENKLAESTKHLRLTHLRIIVDCAILQAYKPDLRPAAADFLYSDSDWDADADAARMPQTLEYLFLEASDEAYAVLRGENWQADRDEGSPHSWFSSTAWRRTLQVDCANANLARGWWAELEVDGELETVEKIAEQEGLGWCHSSEAGSLYGSGG